MGVRKASIMMNTTGFDIVIQKIENWGDVEDMSETMIMKWVDWAQVANFRNEDMANFYVDSVKIKDVVDSIKKEYETKIYPSTI